MTHSERPSTDLTVGSRHVLSIDDIAFGGAGVGRIGGLVVFVPFVLPGEEVEAELIEVKKQYARARLLRVVRPAPQRVAPRCPYFGACGGCQYQHIDYAEQLRIKHHHVADLLERIGKRPAGLVDPVIHCPQAYGYRNRLMVRSQWNKAEQRLVIGFLRADSRLVVDVELCAIADPALQDQLRHVRAHPPPRGGLKVVLRRMPADWEVPPDSFFQNNFHLLPALLDVVRERLAGSGARWLVDAYCGVGFFAIELAGVVERFVGVEYDAMAVEAARRNAARRGAANGEFVVGDATVCLGAISARFPPEETAVIVDPPRVGCRPEAIRSLLVSGPAQILYVSCHPATLARDLNALCGGGVYELVQVTPLDMFPQTQHVECVTDLRRRHPAARGEGATSGSRQADNLANPD